MGNCKFLLTQRVNKRRNSQWRKRKETQRGKPSND
jgi:hypothetical protein